MSIHINVEESQDELRLLLQQYEGTRRAVRILMLLLFLEDPEASIRSVSRSIGAPESTLRRWLRIYQDGGVDALLDVKGGTSKVTSSGPAPPATPSSVLKTPVEGAVPDTLIDLLNRLPVNPDTKQWTRQFADTIIDVFDDIDYAIANIRITVNLLAPSSDRSGPTYRQNFFVKDGGYKLSLGRIESKDGPVWTKLLEDGREHGFPFDEYHEPMGYDFYLEQDVYLGSLVIFRRVENPPTSEATISILGRLRPFMTKVFLYHLAIHQLQRPRDMLYNDVLGSIIADANLTRREGEVIALLVLGHSYDEASKTLGVSKSTLISHVQKIYRKANVAKLGELFARYMTPRIFADHEDEEGEEEQSDDDELT